MHSLGWTLCSFEHQAEEIAERIVVPAIRLFAPTRVAATSLAVGLIAIGRLTLMTNRINLAAVKLATFSRVGKQFVGVRGILGLCVVGASPSRRQSFLRPNVPTAHQEVP